MLGASKMSHVCFMLEAILQGTPSADAQLSSAESSAVRGRIFLNVVISESRMSLQERLLVYL